MTELKDLTNYFTHDFNDDCDNKIYKIFENKYLEYLQQLANSNKWEIKKIFKNEFSFSICLVSNKKAVVISIYDVRKEMFSWYDHISIKLLTIDCEQVKRSNFKYDSSLPKLPTIINKLTNNKTGDEIDLDDIFS